MLPSNAISAVPKVAPYLEPDEQDTGISESLEQGGVAINDGTQGRQVQNWRAWTDGASIWCSPVSGSPVTLLATGAAITSVSIAFDSNMTPTICYLEGEILKLRWFNTVTAAFQTDEIAGATSGKVSTDDKRKTQEGISDVIFAYTKDGTLYWRQQRDRYTIERIVGPSGRLVLYRLGLNTLNRMQFELSNA